MQELGFGLMVNHVKVIASEFAEASGRRHFFNTEKKCASKKRWTNFKQHFRPTIRVPENLSAYRMSMANPTMMDNYFDKLTDTMGKLKIQHKPEDHVWNVDETEIMYTVKPGKIKNLWRTWESMTLVDCICTNGTWISRFIIFKGSRWNVDFKNDCLPDTQDHLSEKGWITNKHIKILFKFYLESTTGSPRPIPLLMVSHGLFITPEVIDLARSNYVHMLTFPSHTTHILQSLYVGDYKALKCAWQKECYQCMIDHPTGKPNKTNFHAIFKLPFVRTTSTENIKNAFRSCVIVPLNRDAIPKEKLSAVSLLMYTNHQVFVNRFSHHQLMPSSMCQRLCLGLHKRTQEPQHPNQPY
ncbi:hypothetical protein PR048_011633 [Dryococelus australis]|uniref:DDE-1 domain-containing protein n=1 Tax=Dryococelus australis TaxID=614101 RepID=A0ABQ9HM35_9NEOP|nr:hypothetical protein PR048_011633 [Dryococelus australis]